MSGLSAHASVLVLALWMASGGGASTENVVPKVIGDDSIADLIASQRGKVLLLSFYATWCEPCLREYPALNKLSARYQDRGLRVIAISLDEPEDRPALLALLKRHRPDFPNYIRQGRDFEVFVNRVDPEWIGSLPAAFVFDRQGKRVGRLIGEQDEQSLEKALVPVLSGKAAHGKFRQHRVPR